MALPNPAITWIRNGEPVEGTDDPSTPGGVTNRPINQLLENDVYLDAELTILRQYLSGDLGQPTPDYLVLPVGTDKFAPDL